MVKVQDSPRIPMFYVAYVDDFCACVFLFLQRWIPEVEEVFLILL